MKRIIIIILLFFIFILNSFTVDIDNQFLNAVKIGNMKNIMKLLFDGADINYMNNLGVTPLTYVINTRKTEMVKFLLENNADVNKKVKDGNTALHIACNYSPGYDPEKVVSEGKIVDDIEIVQLLLDHGADMNIKNDNGMTPYLLASKNCKINKIKFFVEKKVDINQIDKEGYNTIMLFIMNCYERFTSSSSDEIISLISYLYKNGMDLEHKSLTGNSLIVITNRVKQTKIAKYPAGVLIILATTDFANKYFDPIISYLTNKVYEKL